MTIERDIEGEIERLRERLVGVARAEGDPMISPYAMLGGGLQLVMEATDPRMRWRFVSALVTTVRELAPDFVIDLPPPPPPQAH